MDIIEVKSLSIISGMTEESLKEELFDLGFPHPVASTKWEAIGHRIKINVPSKVIEVLETTKLSGTISAFETLRHLITPSVYLLGGSFTSGHPIPNTPL